MAADDASSPAPPVVERRLRVLLAIAGLACFPILSMAHTSPVLYVVLLAFFVVLAVDGRKKLTGRASLLPESKLTSLTRQEKMRAVAVCSTVVGGVGLFLFLTR